MSIHNLFFWSYWFSQPYLLHGLSLALWVGVFLALVLGGIVALIARSATSETAVSKLLYKVSGCTLTMGIFGLLWLFLRQERVPFLAWRFWLLAWVIVFLLWVVPLVRYALFRLPAVRAENAARSAKEKYLP